MAHAERCPICLGEGKIRPEGVWSEDYKATCHGCGGKGWIEVQDNENVAVPLPLPTQEEMLGVV